MNWSQCIKEGIAKKTAINLSSSLEQQAKEKIQAASLLPKKHASSIISLLYDAVRMRLEARAMEQGFRIYNHACYTPFLKEILHRSREGDIFDKVRKTRNSINYYGKQLSEEEAEDTVAKLSSLLEAFTSSHL